MAMIYGLKVPIKLEKGLAETKGLCGYYDPAKKIIVIEASLKGRELLETILHEIDHALKHRLGLWQAKISQDAHEILAESFSTYIVEQMTDKEVKAWTRRLLK